MFILFLDESGTPPKKSAAKGAYMTIGGLIIPEGTWYAIKKDFDEILIKYKVKGEIKFKDFGRSANNALAHLNFEQKNRLRDEIYGLIVKRKAVKIICCVTSIEGVYNYKSMATDDDIYNLTYKGVTERFQYYLQEMSKNTGNKEYGLIISDHRMHHNDEKLRKRHNELMSMNANNTSDYNNIIETVLFSPSHASIGLQLADMVVGAVNRAYQNNCNISASKIKDSFRKSPDGKIAGYGLIKMPKNGFIEPSGEGITPQRTN